VSIEKSSVSYIHKVKKPQNSIQYEKGMETKKVPLGVVIVSIINFLFGFIGLLIGCLSFPSIPSFLAFTTALTLLLSGVGLLLLKRWAWWLAVLGCVASLITYFFVPLQSFPLEIVVLPYLLWKRGVFGIKFKWSKAL